MRAMAVFLPSLEDDFLLMDNRQLSNKEKYPMINYWLELLTAFFKCKDLVSEKKIYIYFFQRLALQSDQNGYSWLVT